MDPARALGCPPALEEALRTFVAEEATAALRHDVRGKLASVRNGAFYVRRKLEGFPEVLEADARVPKFLQLIDDELAALGELLNSRLAPPDEQRAGELDPAALFGALAGSVRLPADVELTLPAAPALKIRADPTEVQLALFCLLENAVEATAGLPRRGVQLEVAARPEGLVSVALTDSGRGIAAVHQENVLKPFFTTRPRRLGLGLKIAQRVARRWGGELEVKRPGAGGCVELLFPGVGT